MPRWRTRADPLEAIWPEAERRLREAPELEAKALFEHLQQFHAEGLPDSVLRTFQRRVAAWRQEHGPEPEVIFAQVHRPGEVMQIDWTRARELAVTVQSRPLDHLFCQAVLPYSNWQWATRRGSESFLSLRQGLQQALFRLGKVPQRLQIDNSSTATYEVRRDGRRQFNAEFLSLVGHFGLHPRTIAVGCPNQNGDVEAHQGHLKRRLHQHLLRRGTRDFESEAAYDGFVAGVLLQASERRATKFAEELAVMQALPPVRLCEFSEEDCRVGCYSTVRVRQVTCSVPSRYIGQRLRARVYEQQVELYQGPQRVLEVPRSVGRRPRIDFRHLIDALLRKPGAFARCRYREEPFPSLTYPITDWHFSRTEARLHGRPEPHELARLRIGRAKSGRGGFGRFSTHLRHLMCLLFDGCDIADGRVRTLPTFGYIPCCRPVLRRLGAPEAALLVMLLGVNTLGRNRRRSVNWMVCYRVTPAARNLQLPGDRGASRARGGLGPGSSRSR